MLLGFLFAWMFIALSQGEQAAMTPVTALWLFALPLMDTVGVMLRRLWLGKSPFRPDRYHLHHLFVRAGFRVCDVVAFAVVMQVAFALVGVGGPAARRTGVSDVLAVPRRFRGLLLLILRPWRLVPWLRRLNRWLGMPSAQVRGIFRRLSAQGTVSGSPRSDFGRAWQRLRLPARCVRDGLVFGRRTQRLLHRARSHRGRRAFDRPHPAPCRTRSGGNWPGSTDSKCVCSSLVNRATIVASATRR
jgi:hypothetical protein